MKNLIKATLITLTILLFVTISLTGIAYNTKLDQKTCTLNKSLWELSADIIIPDDFSTIHEGINNANTRDIIFIRSGVYEENDVIVDKSITLTGENPKYTIIKGNGFETILKVYADDVIVSNLTFINGSTGIMLLNSSGNMISKNIIADCLVGIYLFNSVNQNIEYNSISESSKGLYIEESDNNTVEKNLLYFNEQGVFISYSSNNSITSNNFITNEENAKFTTWYSPDGILKNKWNSNYWDDSYGFLPKVIPGIIYIPKNNRVGSIFFPWFNIDWNPVKEPYVL